MTVVLNQNKIWRDERGSIGIQFGLMLVPMVMLLGASIDIGRSVHARSELQMAVDAGALAAASSTTIDTNARIALANEMVESNMTNRAMQNVSSQVTLGDATVTVKATAQVATNFLGIVGVDEVSIEAKATAKSSFEPSISDENLGKVCLLGLDPLSMDGIHIQGDNQVKYLNCWGYTNSSQPTAINSNGAGNTATGEGHCAVGNYSDASQNYSPKPTSHCQVAKDPFAVGSAYGGVAYTPSYTVPAIPTTCTGSSLSLKKGTYTLNPGKYCNGLSISSGATVTFNPGVYVIDNGVFNVQGGASIIGNNVLFYFKGANARMTIIGGGTVNLKGRAAGEVNESMLFIAHPEASRGGASNFQGGGSFNLEGMLYMPTQRIEVAGNGDINGNSLFFGMVAKDFFFRGNGIFNLQRHDGRSTLPDKMPNMPRQPKQDAYLSE